MNYNEALPPMRDYYHTGATRPYAFRKEQLLRLKRAVLQHEHEIYAALQDDLGKSREESWVTEIGFVITEINAALKHLHHWMAPEKVRTNFLNLPSSSYVMHEPLGVVLIIGPWNYPLQLLLAPLIGAIAGGNCAVLKPSELAAATATVMKKIIESVFPPQYILYVEGDGAEVVPRMIQHFRFDHIFYTGSTAVGKMVYKMAANELVPVTLELGGKSPCVIEADANLKVAARRIAITKFSNAGQMCVAPDYILVHREVKDAFLEQMRKVLIGFFSATPERSGSYGRMINEKQFDRLTGYLDNGQVVFGGRHNRSDRFIEPTILTNVSPEAPIMQDEIFGPIVPVLDFEDAATALQVIERHPDPLAFYVFTSSGKKAKWWLSHVASGGACVNNASWHLTNHWLPFGGRGNSGIGRYHGKFSFETFSHKKAVLETPAWFDPDIKYPPFTGKLGLFKKLIR